MYHDNFLLIGKLHNQMGLLNYFNRLRWLFDHPKYSIDGIVSRCGKGAKLTKYIMSMLCPSGPKRSFINLSGSEEAKTLAMSMTGSIRPKKRYVAHVQLTQSQLFVYIFENDSFLRQF